MQAKIQQVIDRCQKLFAVAREVYGVDLSKTTIRFDLKGRAAGHAMLRCGHTTIRFNRDMLTREAFDHVYNNTVPHEIAHLVCFLDRSLGKNHDSGWERVCRRLGGSGATTHNEKVVFGKGCTYEYITDRGHEVRVGDRHHQYVQRGETLRFRQGKGNIGPGSPCKMVGYQGRTMETPRVIVAAKSETCVPPAPETLRTNANHSATHAPAAQSAHVHVPQQATVTPAAKPAAAPTSTGLQPGSKAARSREIMQSGYRVGKGYEQIIAEMMTANGYTRQLARGTFKANAGRVGIPESFYQ